MSSELILGIIGTITGIVGTITGVYSLYLARKRMQREKPDLYVEVQECKHKVAEDHNSTNLYIKYIVHNKGDRGTQLTKIEASALEFRGDLHHTSEKLSKVQYLDAHSSITLDHYLYFRPHFQYTKKMKCDFKLHHTHGVFPFECESKESKIPI